MLLRALAPGIAALAVLAFAMPGTAMSHPVLVGTTGPGFSIEVTKKGKDVKALKAGTYTLIVHDKASIHDFHLIGPGINKVITSVSFTGTKTVTVTLKKGKYRYQCDPHAASGMKGSFAVIS
jgi:plastocyanin